MNKIKKLAMNHKAAIIFAVLASIIIAFPQIYFRIDNSELYQEGVQAIELLPFSNWTGRVKEVQDGHSSFGSIYYKEGKEDPYLFQPLGTIVVAYMGVLFGLNINNTILLSQLILPFSLFLLLYAFAFSQTRDKLASLSGATAILTIISLLSLGRIKQLLDGVSPVNYLELSISVVPVTVYLLLFGFLASFWVFYKKKDYRWGILSAILLGLNFYNYFYAWTYLYAFGGILVLMFLMRKEIKEVVRISMVFIGGVVVAIPYGINLYKASVHPLYEEVSERYGVVLSHAPSEAPFIIGVIALGALIVFITKFPKEDKERYLFGLALLLTPFITLNQQIITGRLLQEGHYHWYIHKPMAAIFTILTIFYFIKSRGWHTWKKFFASTIIIVGFSTGFYVQALSYHNDYEERNGWRVTVESQKYAPVMSWLDNNAEKEAVVFANRKTSIFVVIYTSLNTFHHMSAQLFLAATEDRLLNSLFSYYRLVGVNDGNVNEIFTKDSAVFSSEVYGIYYRDTFGSYEAIIGEKLDEIIDMYKNTLSTETSEWLYDIWKEYEVEYIVWDKKVDPEWKLDRYSFLKEEGSFGDIAVYSFLDLEEVGGE